MKKKQKKDRLAVCLAWHTPRRKNALESEKGRNFRFLFFALAVASGILALAGTLREFL
jgi:hypothetical protein